MNEPDLPAIGGAPEHYDAVAYGRDFATFRAFMKDTAPDLTILGPGTIGIGADTRALFAVSAAGIDAVSYHHYGALSARCAGDRTARQALSDQWLARTGTTLAFYRALRDRLAPGKPIWLTETAETACGGNRWAATFADTFRYLDQLGRLEFMTRQRLAEGLQVLRSVLQSSGKWQDVLIMTYSEFGRRVAGNDSQGTDHGTAAPHILLGGRVIGGLYGAAPSLTDLDNGDLKFTTDYRTLYATIAQNWYGLSPDSIAGGGFHPLPVLRM